MNTEQVLNQGAMELYHGSMRLVGEKINIQSGTGVDWNSLTLRDDFYTSVDPGAACLFSHLLLQKSRLQGRKLLKI